MDYYNEIDPYCCEWLENLIQAQLLPEGKVDCRSIAEVDPSELASYRRCHFFTGIGGWPLALEMAGWPEEARVWTGSCPCQPFSGAGKREGMADDRDLWPYFRYLIDKGRPATVFGEQVASSDGRGWLHRVLTHLEKMGYAIGAADLCAAGVGTPHIRQRLWWGGNQWLDLASSKQWQSWRKPKRGTGKGASFRGKDRVESKQSNKAGRMEHSTGNGLQRGKCAQVSREETRTTQQRLGTSSYWQEYELVYCIDKVARRIEPGTFPLAHGVSNRVGKLRAYGNSIVPQVGSEFVGAFMESLDIISRVNLEQ